MLRDDDASVNLTDGCDWVDFDALEAIYGEVIASKILSYCDHVDRKLRPIIEATRADEIVELLQREEGQS
jgi:hypothetical protein